MKIHRHVNHHPGFSLPAVLVMSLTIMTMSLALLQTSSSVRTDIQSRYYQTLADEAAEAGTTYASTCLAASNHVQTWGVGAPGGDRPNLTPSTDCTGATVYPSVTSVYSDSKVRSTFVVGALDAKLTDSVQISSTGTVSVMLNGTATVLKSYTQILKKTITWDPVLTGQKSVAGTNRTCAILSGSAYCWGLNNYGQLGDNSTTDSLIPVRVTRDSAVLGSKTVTDIFSAEYHNCVLAESQVYCWGYNGDGQLGNNTQVQSLVPVPVDTMATTGRGLPDPATNPVVAIGGSGDTSCAIVSTGKLYCWGDNSYGTVGVNTSTTRYLTPKLITGPGGTNYLAATYVATRVSSSGTRSKNLCVVANSKAYCWGPDSSGQIGNGTTSNTPIRIPTFVSGLSGKTVTAIAQDGWSPVSSNPQPHVCALASGSVYCWGNNTYGQLGNNSTYVSNTPVLVLNNTSTSPTFTNSGITEIATGLYHSCALANGVTYCWGNNSSGQVGDNTTTTRKKAVAVTQSAGVFLNQTVSALTAGANRSCGVANGRTFCWGLNDNGQIGDGTTINRWVPTEALFLRPLNNQYVY